MFYQLVSEKYVQLIKLRASGNSVCALSSVQHYRLQWGEKVEYKSYQCRLPKGLASCAFWQLNLIDVQLEILRH